MININSYFSGAGLFDIGLTLSGLNIQQSFELDKTCCKTQKANFNHEVIQGDLSKSLVKSEKKCNVMIATYPCTRYSTIANISKTRTGDELYLHFLRRLAIHPPEIYVAENVPGMKKFKVVMETMTKLPDYHVKLFEINTNIWLPQNRPRLIIIASRNKFDWQPPKVTNKTLLKDILEKDPEVKITTSIKNRLAGKYRDFPIISDPDKNDDAPLCVAHYHKDRSTRLVKDKHSPYGVRPYTVREYARLQGVPDWFNFASTDNQAYKMIGNGVPVPIGQWVGGEIQKYFTEFGK